MNALDQHWEKWQARHRMTARHEAPKTEFVELAASVDAHHVTTSVIDDTEPRRATRPPPITKK
jgi:hypothetical protein